MPQQTMRVTAPNGRTLTIKGDRVPTEAELRDIFSKAGVDTEQASETPKQPVGFMDALKASPVGAAVTDAASFLMRDGGPQPGGKVFGRTMTDPALAERIDTAEVMAAPLSPAGPMNAVRAGAMSVPTRARAGAKFQQVMSKVGQETVDVSGPGASALRIQELAERGASRPKVVFDFLKRATDPTKGEPTYQEMRDFYSNISRLSADEMKRLNPVVRLEMGKMRVALDRALAKTAAKGGMESVYREAMKDYAMASRIRELSEKVFKYGAGLVGAGAAVKVASDLTGR